MKVEEVLKLPPLDRFLYWIWERHQIYLRRKIGKPKPWTDDAVLQQFFFTNPYRENDRVTVWFRENIREPLRDSLDVLLATVIFRWFNLPETAIVLGGGDDAPSLLVEWDAAEAFRRLSEVRARGEKVFTGAYMINSPGGEGKLEAICRRVDNVWRDRKQLQAFFTDKRNWKMENGLHLTLKEAHEALSRYEGLGGFMAYEIVCDLRYTYLLENAPDKDTWCNPGPGAIRGLYRIGEMSFAKGNNASSPPRPKDWLERMSRLLETVRQWLGKRMPHFEMREIEHSLCEYDKYSRALEGDGKMKRTYPGA